jgi:hypothetical protein
MCWGKTTRMHVAAASLRALAEAARHILHFARLPPYGHHIIYRTMITQPLLYYLRKKFRKSSRMFKMILNRALWVPLRKQRMNSIFIYFLFCVSYETKDIQPLLRPLRLDCCDQAWWAEGKGMTPPARNFCEDPEIRDYTLLKIKHNYW